MSRCLVVCPGSLVEQWQDEPHQRFYLSFEILTNDKLEAARTGNWFLETNLAMSRRSGPRRAACSRTTASRSSSRPSSAWAAPSASASRAATRSPRCRRRRPPGQPPRVSCRAHGRAAPGVRLLQGLGPRASGPHATGTVALPGIAPVDLAQAAIGPSMAVYTRYAKVLDAEGEFGLAEVLARAKSTSVAGLAKTLAYNAQVQSWPEIARRAREKAKYPPESAQADLF